MIGKDVRDAIENTCMHEVVRSGVAELRQVQRIKGHDMLCDRIPIREGDRIVGAVGKVLFRDVSELEGILQQAQELRSELEFYKDELRRRNGTKYSLDSIVGHSPQMQQLRKLAVQVAKGSSTVLLGGESGTGKELFAHAIHNLSPRFLEIPYPFSLPQSKHPENLFFASANSTPAAPAPCSSESCEHDPKSSSPPDNR